MSSKKPEELPNNLIEIQISETGFKAGEKVSGQVLIRNESPLEVTQLIATLFLRMVVKTKNGIENQSIEAIRAYKTVDLVSNRSKQFSTGPNFCRFSFPALPLNFVSSVRFSIGENEYIPSYFIRIEFKTKSETLIVKEKIFRVFSSYLDDKLYARKWQSKSDKITKNTRKCTMKVTVPTGFSPEEKFIPIHLKISNPTTLPKVIIRSQLLRNILLPMELIVANQSNIENETAGEVNITNAEVIQYLKITNFNSTTFYCPVLTQKYILKVEVETLYGILKAEFPIIMGDWKDRSDRGRAPYNHDLHPNPENETPRSVPSAPPMEELPTPPPTYEEAMRDTPLFVCHQSSRKETAP